MAPATARITLPPRYRIVRHVANGGMASVWEAHDELLDRAVAVKVLGAHLGEDERARKRFEREARTAAGLSSHPHVVTIYDVGEHDGHSFIVMELLRGGTVADKLRHGQRIPRRVEAGGGLGEPLQGQVAGDLATAADAVGQRSAAHELHHHEHVLAVLADVVDRDDVRVRGEARGGARLALEAHPGAVVLAEVGAEHLDRHAAVQQLVVGLPHAGHPAVGEVAHDPIAVGQGDACRAGR